MKKTIKFTFALLVGVLLITGCSKKETELSISPKEVLEKIYDGVDKDNLPMTESVELTSENIKDSIGIDVEFEEAYESKPMMDSIPHSIVVVKLKDSVDVKKVKEEVLKKAQDELYRKWICVEATEVDVEAKGHTIMLVMVDNEDMSKKIIENFKNLK